MPEYPNPVMDQMTLLGACLCDQIASGPATCFCGILPGDAVIANYARDCGKGVCGMAWVRLVSLYPASGIGIPNTEPKNCASGLSFDVEVGILRCVTVGTQDRPPTAEQLMDATTQQMADAMLMRRAITCCEGSDDFILGEYAVQGPEGGVIVGAWTVTMWVP